MQLQADACVARFDMRRTVAFAKRDLSLPHVSTRVRSAVHGLIVHAFERCESNQGVSARISFLSDFGSAFLPCLRFAFIFCASHSFAMRGDSWLSGQSAHLQADHACLYGKCNGVAGYP